jgi:hypothetical protein
VARGLHEQRVALRALLQSRCKRIFGLDSEHISAKKQQLRKGGYAERLAKALARPAPNRQEMMDAGEWPQMRNKDWPSHAPMCTDPERFWLPGCPKSKFRTGPLIRSIQLANAEGLTIVIDPLHRGGKYALDDEVVSFLSDPSYIKLIYAPSQDWLALALSFENCQAFAKSIQRDPLCKELNSETLAQVGWMDVQSRSGGRKIALTAALAAHGMDQTVVDRHTELKKLMKKLFGLPLATVRPLEQFHRIQLPEGSSTKLAAQFIEYSARDASSALYVGALHSLFACQTQYSTSCGITNQLLEAYNSHFKGKMLELWQEPPDPETQDALHASRASWESMMGTLGPLWPGERDANAFSRLVHE